MMRPATPDEIRAWDDLTAGSPGGPSFWQEMAYARLKDAWTPVPAVHELETGPVYALYLQRELAGFGKLWYAPTGPRVTTTEDLATICEQLRVHSPAFAITMEPPLPAEGPQSKQQVMDAIPGLVTAPDIQPGVHTVLVDLRPTEEELLASFKQRARRSLRKVEKAGGVVDGPRTDDEAMEHMWRLYSHTAERNTLMIRGRDYHERLWRQYISRGQGAFFLARPTPDGEVCAATFTMYRGPLAIYKDGGSVRTPEANGLQYLLQWSVMKWAKSIGCTTYDMVGAPPSWQADDETHKFHGLVQFKTSFAPISDEIGGVTLVRKPRVWAAWDHVGRRVVDRLLARKSQYFY